MTIFHCGATLVTDWFCDVCKYEWTTNEYVEHFGCMSEPEKCPNCGTDD